MDMLHKQLKKNEELYADLKKIKQQVRKIHKDRVLIDFTDHGIDHSERIIELLISLCKDNVFHNKKLEYNLNEIEIFILLGAVYLHDIGMQISEETVLKDFAQKKGVIYKSKKKDFIRKYHHLLSGYWIECNMNMGGILPQVYTGDRELGRIIKLVVESHGLDFLNMDAYDKDESYKGKKIRLKILCVLLSLGDSLDCDCRRCDFDKMKYTEIDLFSQLHWLKHYYVKSVMVENSIIKVFYSFPILKEHEKQIYKIYFSYQNIYWIEKNKEKFLDSLNEFNFVFEIQEFFEESDIKERVSEQCYVTMEEAVVDIIDTGNIGDMPIAVANFKIAIGILKKDAKVLLVKRKEKEGNLLWQFPAGIVKPQESLKEKMVKEFLEETGIVVEVKRLLGKRIHPDTKVTCFYFELKYIAGEAINGDKEENEEVKWVSVATYKELLTSNLWIKAEKYLSCNE